MTVRIINADVIAGLQSLPDESVHMVMTSPPYWGLRDYGTAKWVGGDAECKHSLTGAARTPWANAVKGPSGGGKNGTKYANNTKEVGGFCSKCGAEKVDFQIGLEASLGEHLEKMVEVFREVRRVLRPDGSVWLNYGDCYATAPNGRSAAATKATGKDDRTFRDKPFSTVGGVLKPKDLCLVPYRLAIALQEDGWWVRSKVTWGKPNAMPDSSGKWRPAVAHEEAFLLTKFDKSYYDAEAVRQVLAQSSVARYAQDIDGQQGSRKANGGTRSDRPMKAVGGDKRSTRQRGHSKPHAGFSDRWDQMSKEEQRANGRLMRSYEPAPPMVEGVTTADYEAWHIATAAYSEAHFATFPPALVAPCIAASSSAHGVCPSCGAPWVRKVRKRAVAQADVSPEKAERHSSEHDPDTRFAGSVRGSSEVKTLGWVQDCKCEEAGPVPATVLDPFGGAGTVGMVAERMGRDSILIDISSDYCEMAEARILRDGGLLNPSVGIDRRVGS